MVFQSLLNNIFIIYRRSRVSDGQGGWTTIPLTIGAVRGRIRPASSTERVTAQGEEQKITHVLYTLAGANIERGDIVSVGSLSVEVLGVRVPSYANEHYEIDAYEIQYEVTA